MKYIVTVAGRQIDVDIDGDQVRVGERSFSAALQRVTGTPLRHLLVDGRPSTLVIEGNGRGQWTIGVRGERWEVEAVDERTRHIRSLTGAVAGDRGAAPLKAPMPGLVVRILAEPGQGVTSGAGVVVLEAMKMENELKAPADARVKAVRVRPGEPVEKGQVLVEFE
ncbi:MAG: acetyl-CoA carboxylase biotin carboxyl carrier protein subunit [Gemmatimonadales bacterium]